MRLPDYPARCQRPAWKDFLHSGLPARDYPAVQNHPALLMLLMLHYHYVQLLHQQACQMRLPDYPAHCQRPAGKGFLHSGLPAWDYPAVQNQPELLRLKVLHYHHVQYFH